MILIRAWSEEETWIAESKEILFLILPTG